MRGIEYELKTKTSITKIKRTEVTKAVATAIKSSRFDSNSPHFLNVIPCGKA